MRCRSRSGSARRPSPSLFLIGGAAGAAAAARRESEARHGLAYLFISHDLALVRAMADEAMVMKCGRVVERGPAAKVFDRPREAYTRALVQAARLRE